MSIYVDLQYFYYFVQVLFEAVTNAATRNGEIGLDAIRYSPGDCPLSKFSRKYKKCLS